MTAARRTPRRATAVDRMEEKMLSVPRVIGEP